jgi:hypothetical protein
MLGSLISNEELKKKLIKLLRRKYEEPNWLGMQGSRAQTKLNQINHKIQLIKAVCKRRSIDMVEIESIINTWKLMNKSSAHQENIVAGPIGVEQAVEDFLGEY